MNAPVDLEQFRRPVLFLRGELLYTQDRDGVAECDRLLSIIDNQQPAPVVDDAMAKRVRELCWRAEKSGNVIVTEKEMYAIAECITRRR